MDLLHDLTPLTLEEYEIIARTEYASLITDGGILLITDQCRVIHPDIYMTLCIRRKDHPGCHVTLSPITTWSRAVGEKRVGRYKNARRF